MAHMGGWRHVESPGAGGYLVLEARDSSHEALVDSWV